MENLSKARDLLSRAIRLKLFVVAKLTVFMLLITVFSSFAAKNTAVKPKKESITSNDVRKEIVISSRSEFTNSVSQQAHRISGKVSDSKGIPLPGVTIVVVGTTNGTITDANGFFSLSGVSDDDVLKVSFIGYASLEVAVAGKDELQITLSESLIDVDEVVVVGYGSIKKRDLTGAVSSVSSDELVAVGTSSAMAAMQGQVAGVNITARSGLVGSEYDIQIRGVNSLSGGQPLYVVDGVMMDNINFLNPNDIQRIDVLKDASSTAIYGSRGSNGVVIVTTKKSEMSGASRASVSYSGSVGLRAIANMPDFLTYEEGILYTTNRDITKKLYRGDELVSPDDMFGFPAEGDAHAYWKEVLASGRHTDWIDLMTKPAVNTNHFVSASGGAEGVSYMIGAGILSDNGNVSGQYYNKYNFKANIDFFALEQWKMGANINLAYTDLELGSKNIMKQLFRMPPWTPAYNRDGEMIQVPMVGISGNVSPLAVMKYDKYNKQDYYVISNFYLEYLPVKWLSLKTTFSPNMTFNRLGEYWDPLSTKSSGGAYMSMSNNLSYIWDNQLHADREFGLNTVNFDFIHSIQMNRYEYLYGYGWGLPFNSEFYNVGSASSLSASSAFQKSTLMSYTGRVNYDYADKYMFTGSVRWDGSSKLAEGHKWAFFPSAAVAWRLSEEDFMKGLEAVDNMKLRLSYGYTGNNNINAYETQFAVSTQTYYDWDGEIANGFRPSAIANKELTWERTREWNLGLDFGFWDNRVSGELNLYDKLSLNLLMERKLAIPTGWASMMDNVGSLKNQGIELQLRTINIQRKDFWWETNFTFAKNNNEIIELYGKKEDDVANRWFIGQPVDVVYAMEFDGVWQKDELAADQLQEMEGTAKVKDQNNDGKIDIDHDMKILGSPIPDWTGSLSTRFKYKGWDLSATIYTKQGVFIYSPFHREFTDFNSKQILDVPYYMRENPYTEARYTNEYPQPTYQGDYWGEDAEDYGYPGFNKDASFVRLQNIALGYTLPSEWIKKAGINRCRFYVNVVNPYVWTKYEGFDPEWAGASISGENQNSNSFTVYQFGVNLTF